MCGIGGILRKGKAVEKEELAALIRPIVHRGPDGHGEWIHSDRFLGLAHRRLSIIDLSENGAQPFHRLDLGLSITFNGEIYNYIEIRLELEKKGHRFTTSTDTEVILAAYKEFGRECLGKFDGMFAFALWDEKKQELFCARDRFGEKPFHYYCDGQQFIFASEIKQFKGLNISLQLDPAKLEAFMSREEIISDLYPERTFYKNIFSLKAAHFLVCTPELKISTDRYWSLSSIEADKTISFEEAVPRFEKLFRQSLMRRLRADVPLGSSLSGGLDSSAIVYSINTQFLKEGQQQHTFSARFKNYDKDEGEYIDALTAQLKNIHRSEVFLDASEFEKDIDDIIYHQDEPFQSASIFAQYKVMQLAKQNKVTVLLDGQGADELLGGYEGLYVDYLKQLFHNAPSVYSSEVKEYNEMHGGKHGHIDLYKNDTVALKLKRTAKRLMAREQAVPQNYFSGILKQYTSGAALQQLLRYADRNSMAHSIEVRLPFLSHELAEFIFSLPDDFKLRQGWPKYILRKAFDKKLPDKITWRKNKVGFETPENNFLKSESAMARIKIAEEYAADHHIKSSSGVWPLYMTGSYLKKNAA